MCNGQITFIFIGLSLYPLYPHYPLYQNVYPEYLVGT
jgi:hypothetical protein